MAHKAPSSGIWRYVRVFLAGVVLLLCLLAVLWAFLDARWLLTRKFAGAMPFPNVDPAIAARLESSVTALAQNIGQRNVYRPAKLLEAQLWLEQQFSDLGYSVTTKLVPVPEAYRLGVPDCAPAATNIIAEKLGTTLTNEIIVIGAHYDSIAFSKDWTGDNIQKFRPIEDGTPGANDNASGVAVLLELARALRSFDSPRTIRFVAFANEEPPFFQEKAAMGSYVYAQACRASADNIVLMVCLDSLGVYSRRDDNLKREWPASALMPLLGLSRDTNYVAFMSNWEAESGSRAAHWARVFGRYSPVEVRTVSLPFLPRFGKEVFAWSDDWSFTRHSYPAFTVTDTAFYRSDRYHEAFDTSTNLTAFDYRMLAGVTAGLTGLIQVASRDGDTAPPLPWHAGIGPVLGGVLLLLAFWTFCARSTVGEPMRFSPREAHGCRDAWFIETKAAHPHPYSCSFVEFDGRGDFIDFRQHSHAWRTIRKLAKEHKLLLVFYCHGWKNNSQSGDVVEFNSFLGRLAGSSAVYGYGYRVHGVYLSWRGNPVKPYVDCSSEFYQRTLEDFGEPIVDPKFHRRFSWVGVLPETLSYWSRRRAAEHKVSSIPMARAIYTGASLVKALDRQSGRKDLMQSSRVMVMGHSLGALVLERALGPACMSALTSRWSWFAPDAGPTEENPLPIDLALLVNSAAPAVYAKETRDFLKAHRSALRGAGTEIAPVFISLTSTADCATGVVHRIANLLAPLYPSLQRVYSGLLQSPGRRIQGPAVHQSAFFNRTPGHHPLLVDHWIVSDPNALPPDSVKSEAILLGNLDYQQADPYCFYTSPPRNRKHALAWRIASSPPAEQESWRKTFYGLEPKPNPSAYWFIRCGKELISGHNDCWSTTTMEMYAALYRLVVALSLSKPPVASASGRQEQPGSAEKTHGL